MIPERSDQIDQRGHALASDATTYRRRNAVERCVGWLKECRRIAPRFEKLAVHYFRTLKLAMIQKHLLVALSNRP